jgi:hypothetical protein
MSIHESGDEYVQRIKPGLSVEEAIQAFIEACNRRDTLFLSERWLDEKLPQIREHLSNPIPENEALALRELALMKVKSGEVIGWLKSGAPSWTEYYEQQRQQQARKRALGYSRSMIPFPWVDVDACADDRNLQQQASSFGGFTIPGGVSAVVAVSERNGPKTPDADQLSHCPSCGEALLWTYFKSPDWTWQKLCGRAGWLAICRKCRIQADFELEYMN